MPGLFILILYFISITSQDVQPRAVFGGCLYICGGWTMLCKEPIMDEDSPYITIQRITAFSSQFRSCVTVEAAVLGLSVLTGLLVSVDVKLC